MKPEERENLRYSAGAENPVEREEEVMFSLLPQTGGRLLDVGCGVGTISLLLKERGFDVCGIDMSSVAVAKAKERGINATVCDVDRDGIPFADGYFDVVWAGDVAEHVFDPVFLFREMARVLKPDGRLLLTVPNNLNLYSRLSIFLSGKSPQSHVYRRLKQCKHHTLFSFELLKYMLDEAGLRPGTVGAIIRLPFSRRERYAASRTAGIMFGSVFIVAAGKAENRERPVR